MANITETFTKYGGKKKTMTLKSKLEIEIESTNVQSFCDELSDFYEGKLGSQRDCEVTKTIISLKSPHQTNEYKEKLTKVWFKYSKPLVINENTGALVKYLAVHPVHDQKPSLWIIDEFPKNLKKVLFKNIPSQIRSFSFSKASAVHANYLLRNHETAETLELNEGEMRCLGNGFNLTKVKFYKQKTRWVTVIPKYYRFQKLSHLIVDNIFFIDRLQRTKFFKSVGNLKTLTNFKMQETLGRFYGSSSERFNIKEGTIAPKTENGTSNNALLHNFYFKAGVVVSITNFKLGTRNKQIYWINEMRKKPMFMENCFIPCHLFRVEDW